jgi:protein-disulfide isomerase
VLLAAIVAIGLAGCAPGGSGDGGSGSGSASASSAPQPTGTVGAAHLDDGYLVAGSGTRTLDTYIDPMCPICGAFESTNGRTISDAAAAGTLTVRVHPMNFLDRSSQGTAYSTRADAALTCVAARQPNKVLDYLSALYADQPEEGSKGLTDAKLVALAQGVGADIGTCVKNGTYRSWVQSVNDKALAGPVAGTPHNRIEGTPTVIMGGDLYAGSVTDAAAFKAFLAAH